MRASIRARTIIPALLVTLAAVVFAATAGAAAPVAVWQPSFAGSSEATSYPPIAPGPATVLPDFVGSAVAARPLPGANVAQDPGLAPIPYSYIHADSWNSDTASGPAPLGHDLQTTSSTLGMPAVLHQIASSAAMTFDHQGRMITAFVGAGGMRLLLLDPVSLDVLTSYELIGAGTDSLGNAYFFVDDQGRIVIGYGAEKIITLREGGTSAAPTLEPVQDRQWDLSAVVPEGDHVAGLLPDWRGRIWFQTAGMGTTAGPRVGVIDTATSRIRYAQLPKGQQITNGLAVTNDGTFILTSVALHKFVAGSDGRPRQVWRAAYDHSVDKSRLGQLSVGSGTSPTVLDGGKYVAINDSGKQMHVCVYRTATKLKKGQRRLLGAMAVFKGQAGQADANSLLGYRDTIVVENNYGYMWSFDADGNLTSSSFLPGLACIRITRDGKLVKVWENDEVASNSVPRLSTQTGLLYVIARQQDTANDVPVFYWTAVDFRTGKVVWQKLMGTGISWDNYWSIPALGPDGTVYVGNYGGMAAIKDGD